MSPTPRISSLPTSSSSWEARMATCHRICVRTPRVIRSRCLGPPGFCMHWNDDRVTRPHASFFPYTAIPPEAYRRYRSIQRPPWQRTSNLCPILFSEDNTVSTEPKWLGSIRDGEGSERAHHCEHAGMRAAAPYEISSQCEDLTP